MFANKSHKLLTAALVVLLVLLAAVTTYNFILFYHVWAPPEATFRHAKNAINEIYVEPVSEDRLMDGAIRGMIQSLDDPYSHYLTGLEYDALKDVTSGEYRGIGIRIESNDGKHVVVEVFENAPADDAGLEIRDEIVEVDGKDAAEFSQTDLVESIRGPEGTTVRIGISRDNVQGMLAFDIVRKKVQLNPVIFSLLPGNVGYLRIIDFSNNTFEQVEDALDSLHSSGITGLVIDLRGSPGGLLQQAVSIADRFLDGGIIVKIKGRDTAEEILEATDDGDEPSYPVVLLTDKHTASAAEIVASALKENGRAKVVGHKTFGKFSVQRVIDLSDDSALKLTVAKYYTPSGQDLGKNGGVSPDVEVDLGDQGPVALGRKPDPEKDPVLKKALEVLGLVASPSATSQGDSSQSGKRPA